MQKGSYKREPSEAASFSGSARWRMRRTRARWRMRRTRGRWRM